MEATDSILDGAFDTMFTMMRGLFRKERLLDVLHNFIYLPDTPKDEDKIVCRYPQYFATTQLFNNILKHSRLNPDGDGKGHGRFEYHTFLHHSQTLSVLIAHYSLFEYHTFLHHSQTGGKLGL